MFCSDWNRAKRDWYQDNKKIPATRRYPWRVEVRRRWYIWTWSTPAVITFRTKLQRPNRRHGAHQNVHTSCDWRNRANSQTNHGSIYGIFAAWNTPLLVATCAAMVTKMRKPTKIFMPPHPCGSRPLLQNCWLVQAWWEYGQCKQRLVLRMTCFATKVTALIAVERKCARPLYVLIA